MSQAQAEFHEPDLVVYRPRGFTGRQSGSELSDQDSPGTARCRQFRGAYAGPHAADRAREWTFTLKVGPRPVKAWSWLEFNALPPTRTTRDIRCESCHQLLRIRHDRRQEGPRLVRERRVTPARSPSLVFGRTGLQSAKQREKRSRPTPSLPNAEVGRVHPKAILTVVRNVRDLDACAMGRSQDATAAVTGWNLEDRRDRRFGCGSRKNGRA